MNQPDEAALSGVEGYYRHPTLAGQLLVFVAEGDLWTVSVAGGLARRLTTHAGRESHPVISPDGRTLAFSAQYEGPREVYTMPLTGGLPQRWTYDGEAAVPCCWTPGGELVYNTGHHSTLPDLQLVRLKLETRERALIPLSQASEGCFDEKGQTLYFVRPAFHNNVTKRYRGGTARKIWKYVEGAEEAECLTVDYEGESHHPMWWQGRVYFVSDRDGIMNLWSMDEQGQDAQQHTFHEAFDVREGALNEGRIVYQLGADIWLYDLAAGQTQKIPITLASDLDQLRERWVKHPMRYLTSADIHPDGKQVALTARGRVFVMPAKQGRMVQLSRKEGVRYRDAVFSADGTSIWVLSDESGEFEFVNIPASGLGEHRAFTDDGTTLRFKASPSPDGKYLTYTDLNNHAWLLSLEDQRQTKISTLQEGVGDFAWAPDSQWLVFRQRALNTFQQLWLYGLADGTLTALTSDRTNSYSPAWSHDGKWLYFLSDRNFESLVGSPWGPRQPEPYFDRQFKIYHLAMQPGLRSPFKEADELHEAEKDEKKGDAPKQAEAEAATTEQAEEGKEEKQPDQAASEPLSIVLEGLPKRIYEVPVEAGNYRSLRVNKKALFWIERETGLEGDEALMSLPITREEPESKELVGDVWDYLLSADGKKLLVRKHHSLYVLDAKPERPSKLGPLEVDLSGWAFSLDVREDWRQLFRDAWRMERDYFYDPNMHGVDWEAAYEKYAPLLDRVASREELSDLIGRLVGELSALHTRVGGGDLRRGNDRISIGHLGAHLQRTEAGYRIERIFQADPEYPEERSPLADPALALQPGDCITHINGLSPLDVVDIGALLRNQANRQVRVGIKNTRGEASEHILTPISTRAAADLRYRDWQYSRKQKVEADGGGALGYVHLRTMGSDDLSQWYREFYPVFDRKGLIIDVRHNRGGNIDSLILEKLMRKAWFFWKTRVGSTPWNMHYAFRGHMVVLCDASTASDGEAFSDGFRRLGLGNVIGTRTWGGEIWLSDVNLLSDGGLARAPMMGVYGPERTWLIEGRGLEPDLVVDNLPHQTFLGKDAQLDAAIAHLTKLIQEAPRDIPPPPPYPDKAFGKLSKARRG